MERRNVPFFVVGANRSGTTLLRLILNAHSRLAVPDELIYFQREMWSDDIASWQTLRLGDAAYERFVDDFLHHRDEVFAGLDLETLKEQIMAHRPSTLREPYRLSLERWAGLHGKSRWGEKTPGNLFFADVLSQMFPGALFINVVRDPRAVVHSATKAGMFSPDPVFNALNWQRYVVEGTDFLERHVPADRRLTIRYEQLVTDPETTVRRVCGFLGEDYEPTMLTFHRRAGQFMVEDAASSYNERARKPISADRLEAWKSELEEEAIARIDTVTSAGRRRYGYQPMGASSSLTTWANAVIRWAYWRWQVWRKRHDPGYVLHHGLLDRTRHRLRLG